MTHLDNCDGPPDMDARRNPFGFDFCGDANRSLQRLVDSGCAVTVAVEEALAYFAAAPDCSGAYQRGSEPSPTDDPDDGSVPGDPCLMRGCLAPVVDDGAGGSTPLCAGHLAEAMAEAGGEVVRG